MFLLVLVATFGGGARYPFNDVTLSTDARVGDLLGRMSLKDKVGQLFMNAKMAVSPTGATKPYRSASPRSKACSTTTITTTTTTVACLPFLLEGIVGRCRTGVVVVYPQPTP